MKLFYCDHFPLPLPDGHRFPASKYRLLRERLQADARCRDCLFLESPAASRDALRLAHSDDYVQRVESGSLDAADARRIGFPWSAQLVERSRRSVGGTIAASRAALRDGISANLAGGTHHAFADHGEGFCVYNDVAVAIRLLQQDGLLRRAAIVDCDVHQGNGSAAIFRDDPNVFTVSIHGAKNFPLRKQVSDLDLALPDGCEDAQYLATLREHLDDILDRFTPHVVFYIAGADPFEGDRLGRMALSKNGLIERDRFVLQGCLRRAIPVAISMGGGYARRVEDIVDIHSATILTAVALLAESGAGQRTAAGLPADDDPNYGQPA